MRLRYFSNLLLVAGCWRSQLPATSYQQSLLERVKVKERKDGLLYFVL